MVWKPATPQLELVLPGAPASQFHPTAVERRGRRSGSLIRQALYLDQEDAYAAGEVGFLARALVQATLPHSDPKANEFVRRNGHFTLSILAPKDVGLPFGRYPRLVLAYLTTEAVRRKRPDIELGSHFSHFCAALGIPPTTGPRGSLPMLREQLQRLFASTAAVQAVVERFGRLDILVNNAGLMLLGPIVGGNPVEWERMIAINQKGLLYMTNAALPHLLTAAEDEPRRVADIVNISSIAGRVAWANYGVYNMTKFGVNGFTESLRQEITKKHVRVGVVEPGGVDTELGSHNSGAMRDSIDAFLRATEVLQADDVADGVTYMVTRPRHTSISELWIMPTDQA